MDRWECLHILDKVETMAFKELEHITTAGAFTPKSFKDCYEVVDILKDISTIRAMKEAEHKNEETADENVKRPLR